MKKDKRIDIRVTEEEYLLLSDKSKKSGIPLSSYILRETIDPENRNNFKYSVEMKNLLNSITYMIDALSLKYLPEDTAEFNKLVSEVDMLWQSLNS
ncbi:plasmid mobilization protein [Robinsoniella peoriensis]|uniref:plasmid mobilization protein n=1 Tax=Robinsoniella peoriensis TaxID=180332 RepID=UPI003750B4FF